MESVNEKTMTARERRQLRNERRESKPLNNWREEVEERLMKKPKKRYASWTEELNLDTLALLGPQWWVVRVSRGTRSAQETAERLARLLARNFPDISFQVYTAAIQVKKKLKNGNLSVTPQPLFPGCVFLKCVLNKEIHDFIREVDGVGGFIGSKVGNTKKQINKPRPVSSDDIEAIFQQAKEEQEKSDRAFEVEQEREEIVKPEKLDLVYVDPQSASKDGTESILASNSKRRSRIASADGLSTGKDGKLLNPGSTVQVVSGTFAEFTGILKKLDRKTRKATVGFTLFGKETLVDLDVSEVVAKAK